MTINLTSPTCFVSAVLIGDTVISPSGVPDTIPEMTTVVNPTTGEKETANSALEIKSALGGLLLPRLTQAQIDELDYRLKVDGMEVYNVDIPGIQVYQGGGWVTIATEGGTTGAYNPGNPLYLYKNTDGTSIGIFTNIYATFSAIGDNNILIGPGAGSSITSSSDNIGIGTNALGVSFIGRESVGIGTNTLNKISDPAFAGTAVGYNALASCPTSGNTAVGWSAGTATTGSSNTFIGDSAGLQNISGGNSVIIGYHAGSTQSIYGGCILIGESADTTTNVTLSGALGVNAQVSASNSFNLAGTMNYGINNPTPAWALDIATLIINTKDTTGIQIAPNTGVTDLTSAQAMRSSAPGLVLLFVDNTGNLWAANSAGAAPITTLAAG